MTKYIDERTRVRLKFKLTAYSVAFCLQRKRWWGWGTTAWTYPSVMEKQGRDFAYTVEWLLWKETYVKLKERSIGEKMIRS